MADLLTARERWLEACRDARGRGPAWLAPARQRAAERFAARGFPTTAEEEWRFTSVAPIARTPFRPAPARPVEEAAIEPHRLRVDGLTELVFLDGRFAPALSRLGALPEAVRLGSLAQALEDDSGWAKADWIEPWLARLAPPEGHAFVALNTALFADGGFLYVPRGVRLTHPIHLLHYATSPEDAEASHPRHLLVLGEDTQACVIETWAGGDGATYLVSAVTEAALGAGAVLDHYTLVLEGDSAYHAGSFAAQLGRGATLRSRSVSLGGSLIRNDLAVLQGAEGMDCSLDGLFLLGGRQLCDNHTVIDHAHPHGESRQSYRGILDGSSHGVFNGQVMVRAGAQKTNARQSNRNLLLSPDALIDTKPQLEIFANDVKCSHGATIGQLDPDQLFYLRARGLDERAARGLLTYAFAAEVLEGFDPAVRRRVHDQVLDRLPGGVTLKEIA